MSKIQDYYFEKNEHTKLMTSVTKIWAEEGELFRDKEHCINFVRAVRDGMVASNIWVTSTKLTQLSRMVFNDSKHDKFKKFDNITEKNETDEQEEQI